ncbi:SWI/SNF complex component SNF12 homolog [Lycium barbarum]|uniref:SWI/SNF complex component SNF12 homolog n=1 Tax=Lycium barbarum TaxID=112863 RepID=UPI00293E568E|nr:SWI/SNF complex component SNF12 homolog [Lycium barbarum]
MNNNNPVKNISLANLVSQSMPINHNQPPPPHHFSQSPAQRGLHHPGHFQLSESQTQRSNAQFQSQAQAFSHYITSGVNTNAGGVSSTANSTPNTASGGGNRKVLHRPPSRTGGSSSHGQATASPLKTIELTPAVRRKKRKVSDKLIPDKVAMVLPESELYSNLLELEARVDATLFRKKIDMLESLKNSPRIQKTLRIYVFNTFANQTPDSVEPASWSLKILGRILGGGPDPSRSEMEQKSAVSYPKFSAFFKKITVYLDQNLYPDNHVILWDSSRSPALHEGYEIKRKGDKEFTAIIRLEMNYVPEKFKLSPALQEVLGIEVETRARVLAALWYYVKIRKLQISDDTSSFTCDAPLKKVFGEEKLKFAQVSQKITQHLTAPQPIHLEHRIKLSGNSPAGNTCYDVLVDVPLTLQKEMSSFLSSLEKNKEIDAYDETISNAIKKIHEHQRRRAFFLGFSHSPADFINALVASQARDLKLVSDDSTRVSEMEKRSEFYNQPWTEDAVIHYLNRKQVSGTDHSARK